MFISLHPRCPLFLVFQRSLHRLAHCSPAVLEPDQQEHPQALQEGVQSRAQEEVETTNIGKHCGGGGGGGGGEN